MYVTAKTTAVILAAGIGKRMQSQRAKVLHEVGGKPMVCHVVDAVRRAAVDRIIIVAGHQYHQVQATLGNEVEYVLQEEQLGTGHAVLQAAPLLVGEEGTVLVLNGDIPLLTGEEVTSLLEEHNGGRLAASVLSARVDDPAGYGRIVRDEVGELWGIVEDKDADTAQLAINEINVGVYCFDGASLWEELTLLDRQNEQGEYYLTDVVANFRAKARPVGATAARDPQVAKGVNNRVQLAEIACIMQEREVNRLLEAGVTVISPQTTFVECGVEVGQDTVIWPMTFLKGNSRIGNGCEVGPNTTIRGTHVGDNCRIHYSVVEEGQLGDGVTVGPFAHLRPGCHLEDGVRVGNFAEVKNSRIGAGSKVSHHSYIGDSEIASQVNIGAGTVTVNYDGREKYRTYIEEGAFIGCNANLLAPVRIGRGAYVAAGSTVGDDVPAEALAIARQRQTNKENWVKGKQRG